MKVIAAYLLAVLGGDTNPLADDLKAILGSVGAEANEEKIELLLAEVKGKDIAELLAAGREKLGSVPSGGATVSVTGGGATAAAPAAEEPKKEEKKVEEESDEEDDLIINLFD